MTINDLKKYFFHIKINLTSHHENFIDENISLKNVDDIKDYLEELMNNLINEFNLETNNIYFIYNEGPMEIISSPEDCDNTETHTSFDNRDMFFEKCLNFYKESKIIAFSIDCFGLWFTVLVESGKYDLNKEEKQYFFNTTDEERKEFFEFVNDCKNKGLIK